MTDRLPPSSPSDTSRPPRGPRRRLSARAAGSRSGSGPATLHSAARRAAHDRRSGRAAGPGSAPARCALRLVHARNATAAGRACTGGAAARRAPPCRRCSTMQPAYITPCSHMPATTPRSWVIRIRAVCSSATSSRMRSRIWAWIVTSSAVVGSSAMSRIGLAGHRHRDHHSLAHAAGELVGIVLQPLLGAGMPTTASSSMARRSAPACVVMPKCVFSTSGSARRW